MGIFGRTKNEEKQESMHSREYTALIAEISLIQMKVAGMNAELQELSTSYKKLRSRMYREKYEEEAEAEGSNMQPGRLLP